VDTAGSRKELILSERQARLTEAVRQLGVGQVVQGTVLRLEDYGAIVALEGPDGKPTNIQGLLHKKEMSWGMVMTVNDIVQTGRTGATGASKIPGCVIVWLACGLPVSCLLKVAGL
jgi:ribosomal protein S1